MKSRIKEHNYFLIDYNLVNCDSQEYNIPQLLLENIENSYIFKTNLGSNFIIETSLLTTQQKILDILIKNKTNGIFLVIDLKTKDIICSNIEPDETKQLLRLIKMVLLFNLVPIPT